jgi:hypothetical protein
MVLGQGAVLYEDQPGRLRQGLEKTKHSLQKPPLLPAPQPGQETGDQHQPPVGQKGHRLTGAAEFLQAHGAPVQVDGVQFAQFPHAAAQVGDGLTAGELVAAVENVEARAIHV